MDRFQAMRLFARVADTGSFARAARELHVSPPAVTRAVTSLEELIGTRLFVRTTRTVTLTEAGARYLEDCHRILADVQEAEAAAAGSFATPSGTLTISAPALFGRIYVLPVVMDYLDLHAGVTAQTFLVDRVTNLLEEGIDVAIRIGHLPMSNLMASRVGTVRRVVCGSPDYFRRFGTPRTPADLPAHRLIGTNSAWSSSEWRFGQEQKTSVRIAPRLLCNTNDAAIEAAVRGWGLTRVMSYQVAPLIAEGKLVAVLTDDEEEPLPIHVVHPEGRKVTAKVRTFVELATQRLRSNPLINRL
ncbi:MULTISPECIES: LysR family transcriptional regulator [unclassified Beijerinckia]|uniref:LysR family transcriptional regulator n=1 Tax=unclassified Beijerinckia TaxID=2638183 RepID=UPI00089AB9E1|nr:MULTISPECIES: LysR family transcriptional regulator [unclassified Beijerinckia]MDH7796191.1 DNA-binding transcriptional LysR family regulator [Beijerinckia sp. GAS462]SEC34290.1 DNA-binding transcriptional regulator, LysR family [Beijerinckia sp. 28-YEA-48]